MQIIGCDLHTPQQTLAIMDTETGELVEKVLVHEASNVRNFYSTLRGPVRVGIEATGSMQWFLNLMEERRARPGLGRDSRSSHCQFRRPPDSGRGGLAQVSLR